MNRIKKLITANPHTACFRLLIISKTNIYSKSFAIILSGVAIYMAGTRMGELLYTIIN